MATRSEEKHLNTDHRWCKHLESEASQSLAEPLAEVKELQTLLSSLRLQCSEASESQEAYVFRQEARVFQEEVRAAEFELQSMSIPNDNGMANHCSGSHSYSAHHVFSKRKGAAYASDAIDREVERTLVPALPPHLRPKHVGLG